MHGRGCMAGGMCGRGHVWQGGHAWQGGTCMAGEMATAADGMYPTGMHSCYLFQIIRGGLNGVANTVTYECHSSNSCQTSNDVNNLFGHLFNNLGVSANTYCCEADKCNSQNADGGATPCNFSFALLCTISTLYILLGNLY